MVLSQNVTVPLHFEGIANHDLKMIRNRDISLPEAPVAFDLGRQFNHANKTPALPILHEQIKRSVRERYPRCNLVDVTLSTVDYDPLIAAYKYSGDFV